MIALEPLIYTKLTNIQFITLCVRAVQSVDFAACPKIQACLCNLFLTVLFLLSTSQQTAVQDGLHRCQKTLHTVLLKMLKSPNRTKSVLPTLMQCYTPILVIIIYLKLYIHLIHVHVQKHVIMCMYIMHMRYACVLYKYM